MAEGCTRDASPWMQSSNSERMLRAATPSCDWRREKRLRREAQGPEPEGESREGGEGEGREEGSGEDEGGEGREVGGKKIKWGGLGGEE